MCSWFKEKEAINSYEKMLKSARCFPGGGSRWWAWAPCCLCASPSTQREEAGGDSKLVLGVELPSPGGGGGGGGSGHGGVERRPGLPTCGLEGPFPPNHLPSSLLFLQHDHKDEKTLFLEKKHLFHHNQSSGEPKKQGFFRSWRKVAMISAEKYFLEFDIGEHLSQNWWCEMPMYQRKSWKLESPTPHPWAPGPGRTFFL